MCQVGEALEVPFDFCRGILRWDNHHFPSYVRLRQYDDDNDCPFQEQENLKQDVRYLAVRTLSLILTFQDSCPVNIHRHLYPPHHHHYPHRNITPGVRPSGWSWLVYMGLQRQKRFNNHDVDHLMMR